MTKIKFHTNWCPDEHIREEFNRCTVNGDYTWKDLYLTLDDDYDFFIIMNHPKHNNFKPGKAILFHCEPESTRGTWGEYRNPDKDIFFKVYDPDNHHNVDKWYIDLNYRQLLKRDFTKTKIMSGIVSSCDWLEGHKERLNFLKYLDTLPYYDHYGKGDLIQFLNSYQGPLDHKEDGIIPYKYHFNAENTYERNYFTEKIMDAIFCESLCFYAGCPNIKDFIDPGAFIKINLKKPEEALDIIKESIANHEYEKRLPLIKKEKDKLMNEMNPLNIIYKIIHGEIK
jgi:hypothetical protein